MTNRSIFLAAASVAAFAFGGASSASAQDSGLYGSVSIGSTDAGATSAYNLSPSGTVVDLRLGDVIYDNGDFTVAAEAGVQIGDVSDSEVIQTCDIVNCGFDETDTERRSVDWSGSFGFKVGHELGPVTAFITGGVRVAKVTQSSSYDSGGLYPTWKHEDTAYAFGAYYGAGVARQFTPHLAGTVSYERANLTQSSWSSSWGSGKDGFEQETVSAGLVWTFGK